MKKALTKNVERLRARIKFLLYQAYFMDHRPHTVCLPVICTVVFFSSVIFLTGCAQWKDRYAQGAIMCSIELENKARSKESGQLYVNKWLTDRNTSYQVLLGKTRQEVQAILGSPYRGEVKGDCEGLRAALGQNPKDTHAAYQLKFWCEEDRSQWFYAIPRWYHLRGCTFCVIHFENGRVVAVGNAASKDVRKALSQMRKRKND